MAKTSTVKERATGRPRLRNRASIADDLNHMREEITRRAYEIFNSRGSSVGRELDDWLQAERELTWKPPVELTEQGGSLKLDAAVAGFEPEELDVQITSEDILIRSERVHRRSEDTENVYRCDFKRGKLFCGVRLPKPVDPGKAEAQFRNGLLSITAPLAEAPESTRVEIAGS